MTTPQKVSSRNSRDSSNTVVSVRDAYMYFSRRGTLTRALQGISFDVRRGEIFGLFGAPGCGKSTTLRLLAGRLGQTDGRIRVFGRRPRRRAARARTGYVPQDHPGGPLKTGQTVTGLIRKLLGIKTVTATVPLGSHSQLSSLKKVLIRNPDLLLLDQPFAGLDVDACREIKNLLRSLAARGKTIVLSSSSFYDVEVCDRIALYSRSRIEAIGTAAEVLSARDSIGFIAQLLPSVLLDRIRDFVRESVPFETVPATDPSSGGAGSQELLRKLATAPSAVAATGPGDVPFPAVNHDKLAALTIGKPGRG